MRTLLLITLLIFVNALASCEDRSDILVTGQITDEVTGKPIPKAEVVVLCWYMSGIDDASFKKQTIITDGKGNYKASFAKGHQVDIASKANGFIPNRQYNELTDNRIQVNLKLARAKENPTLIKHLSTDYVDDETPFLRIRIHSLGSGDTLDLNNVETFGFDFSSLKTVSDTTICDIWFKIIHAAKQPDIICTNKNGGVIPVYSNDIKSSFFYEKPLAPNNGYRNEYKFKGNEEGFFVLCRDGKTYGKIVFVKSAVDKSSPDGKGGFYKDFGKEFSCLYQPNGTNDLSYSTSNVDLEDFLVDYRLR